MRRLLNLLRRTLLVPKELGPCYSNSGSWSTGYSSEGRCGGRSFFFQHEPIGPLLQKLRVNDQSRKGCRGRQRLDLQSPFGNLFTGTNIGVVSTGTDGDRLDDVAYYGRTLMTCEATSSTQSVSFYAVNAMGTQRRGIVGIGAKYGGFDDRNDAVDLTGSQFVPIQQVQSSAAEPARATRNGT
jgi:hypothetical protein